jgi:rRNA-processing protein FCF1
VRVVGTGGQSADDWITAEAERLAAAGEPYWLVTSDRELRKRAGGAAERVIGGGSFVALIT